MKTRLVGLSLGMLFGLLFTFLLSNVVQAHQADAFDTETYWDGRPLSSSSWTRAGARTFSRGILGEPYSMLGGWWRDNNTTDPQDPVKGNEGTDCSGLLFKTWMLVHEKYVQGYKLWYNTDDTHGPYQAIHFFNGYNGCSSVCNKICGSSSQACGTSASLLSMDAFVGLDPGSQLYHVATYDGKDASGYDIILDTGDPWYERHSNYYRTTLGYIGIRRYYWVN